MLLNTAKRLVRSLENQGKLGWLTRILTYIWVQQHNASDWLHKRAIEQAISDKKFPETVEDAVNAVMHGDIGRPIRPMQVTSELTAMIRRVAAQKPKTVLEIGTARGGTFLLLCRFAAPDATIVSVDLPYGRNGGGYPRWKEKIYRSFARSGQNLHLLRANSHEPETFSQVSAIFGSAPVDFMLIDADHSYEGAKSDFEAYRKLAKSGSIIALHDILPNLEDPSIHVDRLWHELEGSPDFETETIVESPSQGRCGIGLVKI